MDPAAEADAATTTAAGTGAGRRRFVCVGDEGVGKTALLATYVGRPFPVEHVPTVSDTFTTTAPDSVDAELDGTEIDLIDTPGSEDFDRLRPLNYAETDLWIVCFAVDDRRSLMSVADRWVPEVRYFDASVPLILVATKCDLRDSEQVSNPVTLEEGQEMAFRVNAFKYVETSAKLGFQVSTLFDDDVDDSGEFEVLEGADPDAPEISGESVGDAPHFSEPQSESLGVIAESPIPESHTPPPMVNPAMALPTPPRTPVGVQMNGVQMNWATGRPVSAQRRRRPDSLSSVSSAGASSVASVPAVPATPLSALMQAESPLKSVMEEDPGYRESVVEKAKPALVADADISRDIAAAEVPPEGEIAVLVAEPTDKVNPVDEPATISPEPEPAASALSMNVSTEIAPVIHSAETVAKPVKAKPVDVKPSQSTARVEDTIPEPKRPRRRESRSSLKRRRPGEEDGGGGCKCTIL